VLVSDTMWDHISIFSKTGVVLWQRSMQKLKSVGAGGGSPINELVRTVLLEDKAGQSTTFDSYALKWTFENELDLVVVIVYQKMLQCVYAEELVESVKAQFVKVFGADLAKQVQGGRGCISCASLPLNFDKHFDKCLSRVDRNAKQKRAGSVRGGKVDGHGGGAVDEDEAKESKNGDGATGSAPGTAEGKGSTPAEGAAADAELNDEDAIMSARARLAARAGRRGKGGRPGKTASGGGSSASSDAPGDSSEKDGGKKKGGKKEGTVWRDGSNSNKKISKSEAASLDFSKKPQEEEAGLSEDDLRLKEYQEKYLPDQGEVAEWEEDDEHADESDDDDDSGDNAGRADSSRSKGWFGKSNIGSFLQSITGNKVLDKDDLAPVLDQMRHQLIGKNVAAEIADDICASVAVSLDGQKLASFSRVESTVVAALKAAVLRILTPRKSTDILHDIRQNRSSGKPYVIAFVGINGVGKSTSLAKICYYLKQNGVKVSIAACDTFRSGAVEQLRSHARCLEVPLFERGYLKVRRPIGEAYSCCSFSPSIIIH
jgi:signal recognition particle receptor subunit alpha